MQTQNSTIPLYELKARTYVGGLRRTNQYRRSYWYLVVFDVDSQMPRGHQLHQTRNLAINRAFRDFNGNSVIVKGSNC